MIKLNDNKTGGRKMRQPTYEQQQADRLLDKAWKGIEKAFKKPDQEKRNKAVEELKTAQVNLTKQEG